NMRGRILRRPVTFVLTLVLLASVGVIVTAQKPAPTRVPETVKVGSLILRLKKTLSGPRKQILAVVFAPDAKSLATRTWEAKTALWNTETGRLLDDVDGRIFHPFSYSGNHVISCFSADGRALLTTKGKEAKLWDTATGNWKR